MNEAANDENKESDIREASFKCPFCPCEFCTKSDLQRHIDHFGSSEAQHVESFRRVHDRLEQSAFSEQEG